MGRMGRGPIPDGAEREVKRHYPGKETTKLIESPHNDTERAKTVVPLLEPLSAGLSSDTTPSQSSASPRSVVTLTETPRWTFTV